MEFSYFSPSFDRTSLHAARTNDAPACKVLMIIGTRPEAIKLAPVIRELEDAENHFAVCNVITAQHTDLLYPLLASLGIRGDYNLRAMEFEQTLNGICAHMLAALETVIAAERPAALIVQGDTTSALTGALAGFHRGIPVCHVEAGLRTESAQNPFPEEMNRRLISRLATYHFAATELNRDTLLTEGIDWRRIFVTGNTIVDSLREIQHTSLPSATLDELLTETADSRRIVLTAHRRESFGETMSANFEVLRQFISAHDDTTLIFPVHPNPNVRQAAYDAFAGEARIHLIEPLDYGDFIHLLSASWLIVSDSGGVQEEAPTLGKPLLILRANTERPEAVRSGVARLVGDCHKQFASMLEEAYVPGSWTEEVGAVPNPFGSGDAGEQIAAIMQRLFNLAAVETRQQVS